MDHRSLDVDDQPLPHLGGALVLIVDDNADNREMLATFLNASGARAVAAGTAGSALDHLARTRFDVVISDLSLKGTNGGMDLIRAVRTGSDINRLVFAIALSGMSIRSDAVLQAGYDVHMIKPVELESIASAILGRPQSSDPMARARNACQAATALIFIVRDTTERARRTANAARILREISRTLRSRRRASTATGILQTVGAPLIADRAAC